MSLFAEQLHRVGQQAVASMAWNTALTTENTMPGHTCKRRAAAAAAAAAAPALLCARTTTERAEARERKATVREEVLHSILSNTCRLLICKESRKAVG